MKTLIFVVTLLHFTGQAMRPCNDAKTKDGREISTAFGLKGIHRLETRMDSIKDGMSVEEAFKLLKISKKKNLNAVAHGAATYLYLGEGYNLVIPFGSPEHLKRILLINESGKTVKVVDWR